MHILVVDDSPDTLALITLELELLGHRVTAAKDAYSALQLAGRDRPDLLISDLRLPEVDGFDLVRQIRELKGLQALPAIALTGLGAPEEMQQARRAGFDGHLLKPLDDDELAAEVEAVMRKRVRAAE